MKSLTKKINELNDLGLNLIYTFKGDEVEFLSEQFEIDLIDKSLIWVGTGGGTFYNKNSEHFLNTENPMDDTAEEFVIKAFNLDKNNIHILYPNQTSHFPLQRLSRALGISKVSPLGIDIHPLFGLWFSIRLVFICPKLELSIRPSDFQSPCESCISKKCLEKNLSFTEARLSCPYKKNERYSDAQLLFHQVQLERNFKRFI